MRIRPDSQVDDIESPVVGALLIQFTGKETGRRFHVLHFVRPRERMDVLCRDARAREAAHKQVVAIKVARGDESFIAEP